MTRRQDRNGVRVRVTEHSDGTTVESECACFGHPWRVHSAAGCPRRPKTYVGLALDNATDPHFDRPLPGETSPETTRRWS